MFVKSPFVKDVRIQDKLGSGRCINAWICRVKVDGTNIVYWFITGRYETTFLGIVSPPSLSLYIHAHIAAN